MGIKYASKIPNLPRRTFSTQQRLVVHAEWVKEDAEQVNVVVFVFDSPHDGDRAGISPPIVTSIHSARPVVAEENLDKSVNSQVH